MTKSDLTDAHPLVRPAVPKWIVLDSDGCLHEQQGPYHHPTRVLEADDGAVLAIKVGALQMIVAPGPMGMHSWISTVDVLMSGGVGSRRMIGPGIRTKKAARLWVSPSGDTVILTDGPLEQALRATERLREATSAS